MNLQAVRPNLPVALTQSLIPTLVSALPCRVAAGFPSPAEDHAVQRVDLMAQLIKHPQATFLLRVRGESMKDAGIFDNDVVLVDRVYPHAPISDARLAVFALNSGAAQAINQRQP